MLQVIINANPAPVIPLYDQQENEPSKWFAKFLLYRNMPANKRSLLGAYGIYQPQAEKGAKKQYKRVPGAWNRAFELYNWKARAEAYDKKLQAEAEERQRVLQELEAAEIARIMTTGYALKHERVKGLDAMARLIEQSWISEDKETGEKITVFQWLTPDKVKEYRGCLDDIAKELGDRVSKRELTGKDGGPIEIVTEWGGGAIPEADGEG